MLLKRIQLGLIHMAVAMTLVPINSTLNRVMINEFFISATLVAILASLPYIFSPIQVAIGSFADRHPIAGLRRTPYIFLGLVLCCLGVILSPYVAFLLAENFWVGILAGLVAFGLWGMGYNFSAVSYLSLATEISGEKERGRTIAVMFFLMVIGIILTALTLGRLLQPYTAQELISTSAHLAGAFRIIGVASFIFGIIGLVKLEPKITAETTPSSGGHSWPVLLRTVFSNQQAKLFFIYLVILLAALLGQDLLLEPYAAHAFNMEVHTTTRITSIWGGCMLITLIIAGILEKRAEKKTVARWGGWMAFSGFFLIVISSFMQSPGVFYSGVVLLGGGTGLATVSNLSLMLDMTTAGKVGLYVGAWGVANALSRLMGTILAGGVRDVVTQGTQNLLVGYQVVFSIEAAMLFISLLMLSKINVAAFRKDADQMDLVERAAIANEL
jgi:MFS transporter, BCD family, chlorophyll transporter